MEAKIFVSQLCDGNHATEFVAIISVKNSKTRIKCDFLQMGSLNHFFEIHSTLHNYQTTRKAYWYYQIFSKAIQRSQDSRAQSDSLVSLSCSMAVFSGNLFWLSFLKRWRRARAILWMLWWRRKHSWFFKKWCHMFPN